MALVFAAAQLSACTLGGGARGEDLASGAWTGAWYRAGQHERAIEVLKSIVMEERPRHVRSIAYPVLAMAHHRLGHADEARQASERRAADPEHTRLFGDAKLFDNHAIFDARSSAGAPVGTPRRALEHVAKVTLESSAVRNVRRKDQPIEAHARASRLAGFADARRDRHP